MNADDGETVDLGVASVAVGFAAPGSTDTISKLKFSDGLQTISSLEHSSSTV